MHVIIAVEGHSAAIKRFESDIDRRQYPGKGRDGGTAVVKLGELKFYDLRINKEAREDLLKDLKGIGFRPVEEWARGWEHDRLKLGLAARWFNRVKGWLGLRPVRDWEKIEAPYIHGLGPGDEQPPWRIGAGGYCMWKIVLGEFDDKHQDGQEQI